MSVTGQQLWHFCPDNISQVLNIVLGYKNVHIFFFNKKKIHGGTIYIHKISAVPFFGLKTFLINNFIVSMTKFATYCSFYPSTAAKVFFLCLCPDLRRFQKFRSGVTIICFREEKGFPKQVSSNVRCVGRTAKTQYQKFETNIHRKGIARPQFQFPHLCVCERFIYSHDRSSYSAAGKYVNRS